jgi:MoaA/NifB/PqqE/SkfB family radical SAM enzyme
MESKNPIFCDIGITENCIFKCKMCRLWQSPRNPNELSLDEWKDFVISLKEFGTKDIRLHFAGGEPLLKEGILDLIEFANKNGFTTVMVTNGFLIDEVMAQRIAHSGLGVISISLDSLAADIHDFLRGIKGAYKQVIQAIDYLSKLGGKNISILAVIMGFNLDGVVELAEWVDKNDNLSSIYFQAVSQPIAMSKDQRWYDKEEFSYLWPKDKIYLDYVIDRLIDYKNRGYKIANSIRQLEMFKAYFRQPDKLHDSMGCTQGDYVIYIRPAGEVLLCGSMAPIGNVRRDNIKKLWHSQEAALRRKDIYSCKESCLNVINCFENKDLP